jgi:hypothetical protein
MDYKEKYEHALETVQEIISSGSDSIMMSRLKLRLQSVFPEIRESEDEKIRKEIISFLQLPHPQFIGERKQEKWIAWLEKSIIPNHNDIDSSFIEDIKNVINEAPLLMQSDKEKMIVWLEKQGEPQDKGEISDGYHTFNELYYYRMLYNAAFFNMLPKEWVHKSKRHNDGEECFGGGWFIVMANLPTGQISNHYELKDWDLFQIPEKEVADKWDGHTPQEAADRLHKYLLEKRGEQKSIIEMKSAEESLGIDSDTYNEIVDECIYGENKPADKVKPKFKVGDKVKMKEFESFPHICTVENIDSDVYYCDFTNFDIDDQNGWELVKEPKFKVGDWVVYDHRPYQIVELPKEGYINLGLRRNGKIEFAPSTYCRHWTIQDAKDGDVLVFDDIIMIFKNIKTVCTANTYILYCNGIVVGDWCDFGRNAQPATKEQRDFLFQKMKEAGYEWDAERKELKKFDFSKPIKYNSNPPSIVKESDWSEEDEKILNTNISFLSEYAAKGYENAVMCIDWLKSLKQRIGE